MMCCDFDDNPISINNKIDIDIINNYITVYHNWIHYNLFIIFIFPFLCYFYIENYNNVIYYDIKWLILQLIKIINFM
jgi:hypothetical protein